MSEKTLHIRLLMLPLILLLCAAVSGCGGSIGGRAVGKTEYFGITADEQAAIIVDDAVCEEPGIMSDGEIYIPYYELWNRINSGFYLDENTGTLYLTLPSGTKTWTEEDGTLYRDPAGNVYVSAACVAENSDIDMERYEDPARLVIRTKWDGLYAATANADTGIHLEAGSNSGVIREIAQGDKIIFVESKDGWSRVSTDDGFTGYVKDEEITVSDTPAMEHVTDDKFIFDKVEFDGTVRMIWDYIEFVEDNTYLEAMLQHSDGGINVISPTWFNIADMNGELTDLGDASYVQRAHDMGMQVWAMLGDYYGESGSTGEALTNSESRQNITRNLMLFADAYGFDGINIDLENVNESQAPAYLQFIKEVSVAAHEKGIIVSVDNYVPTYTGHYKRAEQFKTVDYLVVMAYDEHTASSEEPGPVASLPFVVQGIEDTLKEVPAENIILGVPFYCRTWTVTFGYEGFETSAVSMENAMNFVNEHGIELAWDSTDGQYTGTSEDGTARYSIWLEDNRSLEEKLKLVSEYGLKGASAWRLGYEKDDVWNVWNKYLK